ncbi:Uncharacterized protein TCM_007732 [Theobroma cacao]|uniref:Uncharacterized protein n=1 Tax=Theobroma cacao TaxID=3641 RepID=A0A061EA19_THECC|nr:Uncharacterized protein TCM_007732 [Theobroma cacao]
MEAMYLNPLCPMCATNGDIVHMGAMYLDVEGQLQVRYPYGETRFDLEVFYRQLIRGYINYTHNYHGELLEDLWHREAMRQQRRCLDRVRENVTVYKIVTCTAHKTCRYSTTNDCYTPPKARNQP